MYSAVVRPIMVYGFGTVAVTKKQVEEMEVAKMRMLRFAKEVMRKDKFRNLFIYLFIFIFILLTRRKATEALYIGQAIIPTCFWICQDIAVCLKF